MSWSWASVSPALAAPATRRRIRSSKSAVSRVVSENSGTPKWAPRTGQISGASTPSRSSAKIMSGGHYQSAELVERQRDEYGDATDRVRRAEVRSGARVAGAVAGKYWRHYAKSPKKIQLKAKSAESILEP